MARPRCVCVCPPPQLSLTRLALHSVVGIAVGWGLRAGLQRLKPVEVLEVAPVQLDN